MSPPAIIITIGAVIVGLIFLNLIAALILALYLGHPGRKTFLDDYFFTPFETGVMFEQVWFVTPDGVKISGWWLMGRGKRVVVGLAGRSGIKSDLLGVGSYLAKAGFHVLLFDFRGRGESDKATLDMGRREAIDAAAAIDFTAARIQDARIGLIGFSLGAVAAILAARRDQRILSLALDSPFESPDEVMRSGMRRFFPITRARFAPRLARMWGRTLFGYDIGGIDIPAYAAALRVKRALVIVSGNDSVIPPAQQHRVYDSLTCPKELWEVPGVDHCGAYFADRKLYVEKIIDFFDRTL